MRAGIIAFLLPLLFLGCGYHVQDRGNSLPADVQTVYTGIFANRTLEPFLDIVISDAVSERFIRGRMLRVVDRAELASALLAGEVVSYTTSPVGYDRGDEIARYRSTMVVSARLARVGTSEVLWKGTVSWNEEYEASQDKAVQEDNEAAAIRTVGERIAEEIYFRLGDNF